MKFTIYSPQGEVEYTPKENTKLLFSLPQNTKYKFFSSYIVTGSSLQELKNEFQKENNTVCIPSTEEGTYALCATPCLFQTPNKGDIVIISITLLLILASIVFMLTVHIKNKKQ